jgi:chromosome segregation ATPase
MAPILRINFYIILLGMFLISGCCTPGIKPEDANIFQAVCGISSGDFDKQLEAAREDVQLSEKMLESENQRSMQLQTELAEKEREHARLERELDSLENSSKQIERQIKAIRAVTDGDNRRMNKRLAELEKIKAEMERLKLQQSSVTNEALQQKVNTLKREVEVLRRISIEQ